MRWSAYIKKWLGSLRRGQDTTFWKEAHAAHNADREGVRQRFHTVKEEYLSTFREQFPGLSCSVAPDNWPLIQFEFDGHMIKAERAGGGTHWQLSLGVFPSQRIGVVYVADGKGSLYRECHRMIYGTKKENQML